MNRHAALTLVLSLAACSQETPLSTYAYRYSGNLALDSVSSDLGFEFAWNESDTYAGGVYTDNSLAISREAALTGRALSATERSFRVALDAPTGGVAALQVHAVGALGTKLAVTITALDENDVALATAQGKAWPGAGHTAAIPAFDLEGRLACAVDLNWSDPPAIAHPGVALRQADGSLYTWGDNDQKAIGQGDSTLVALPTAVGLPAGVTVSWVTMGKQFGAAIGSDRQIYYWGHFVSPYGVVVTAADPTAILTEPTFVPAKIYAGLDALFVIDTENRVWAMGSDALGQQGNAAVATDNAGFAEIPTLAGSTSLSTSAYSATVFALKNGELWSWGDSTHNKHGGTLGAGPYPVVEEPARVLTTFNDIAQISQDFETGMAVRANGETYTFGNLRGDTHKAGRSGDASTEPALVTGFFAKITSGLGAFTLVRDGAGDYFRFGTNLFGSFGLGEDPSVLTGDLPRIVDDFPEVSAMKSCGSSLFVVKPDGSLWAAGRQEFGGLGDGVDGATNATSLLPISGVDLF